MNESVFMLRVLVLFSTLNSLLIYSFLGTGGVSVLFIINAFNKKNQLNIFVYEI